MEYNDDETGLDPSGMDLPVITVDQFIKGASYFMGAAFNAYIHCEYDVVTSNAAIAVEHLSKALLFSMDPSYLVELHAKQFDALLFLTGRGDKVRKLKTPRTIGAKEALMRVRQVMEIGTPNEPLDKIIEIRDGVVHTGFPSVTNARELLTIAVRYASEIYEALEALDVEINNRWGYWDYTDLANSLMDPSLSDAQHQVHQMIESARERFAHIINGRTGYQVDSMIEFLKEGDRADIDIDSFTYDLIELQEKMSAVVPIKCPVCGNPDAACEGNLCKKSELPQSDSSLKGEGEVPQLSASVRFTAVELSCGVCDLWLRESELREVGIPEGWEITSDIEEDGFLRNPNWYLS